MKILSGALFLVFGALMGATLISILLFSIETVPRWVKLSATDASDLNFIYYGFIPLLISMAWPNWWWQRKHRIIILHSAILGFIYAIIRAICVIGTFMVIGLNFSTLVFITTCLLPLSLTVFFVIYCFWHIKLKNI